MEVLLGPTQSQAGAQLPILHLQGHDCLGAGGHIAVGQVHDDAVILSCLQEEGKVKAACKCRGQAGETECGHAWGPVFEECGRRVFCSVNKRK